MSRLEVITTDTISRRRKLRFWNDTVSNAVFGQAQAEPVDADGFGGVLRRLDLDCFRFVEISAGAARVRRLPNRDRNAHLVFQLSLEGEIRFRLNGVAQSIYPGDFLLYEVSTGGELELPGPVRLLSLCVPREEVLRHISCPEMVSSRVISGDQGPAALVSRYMLDFWASAQKGMAIDTAVRFARIGVELMASAYADIPATRSSQSGLIIKRRVRIQAYIEDHLSDPDLTPTVIAQALGMTPSYLHRLFGGVTESVAQHILRRRLAECHRVLADPLRGNRSISSIALDYGFNSLSHFSHAFRARYGVTPSQVQSTAGLSGHLTRQII